MELYEDNDVFPNSIRQLYELTKCNQRQARMSCMKNDMRQLLSEEATENGTLTEIYEDLLNKVVEISTFHENFDNLDSLVQY